MNTYEFLVNKNQLKSILYNNDFKGTIFNLYDRCKYENDYESIKDYAKSLENIVSRIIGVDIKLKMSKRPFCFRFRSNYAFTTETGDLDIKVGQIEFIVKENILSYKVRLVSK